VKGKEGQYDIIVMKQFEPKTPIETGRPILRENAHAEGVL
jgi:hypothetical protein